MPVSVEELLARVDRLQQALREERLAVQQYLINAAVHYDERLNDLRRAIDPPRGERSGMAWRVGCFFPHLGALEALQSADGAVRPCDEVSLFGWAGTVGMLKRGLYADHAVRCAELAKQGYHIDVALRAFPHEGTRPASWPARLGDSDLIAPTHPPGSGTPTRADAVQVWLRAAEGYFDDLWRAQLQAVARQLGTDARISYRPFWEGDAKWQPLKPHSINSACWSVLEDDEEVALFHAVQRRWAALIRESHGANAGLFLCALKGGDTKRHVLDYYAPDALALVGLDYYDMWPCCPNAADYLLEDGSARINARSRYGSPRGLNAWLTDLSARLDGPWAAHPIEGIKIGEWGVVTAEDDPGFTWSGGDNPLFVLKVWELLWRHRRKIAAASYFNSKPTGQYAHRLQQEPGGPHPLSSTAYQQAFARHWRLSQYRETM
jgi:hypothetical protein